MKPVRTRRDKMKLFKLLSNEEDGPVCEFIVCAEDISEAEKLVQKDYGPLDHGFQNEILGEASPKKRKSVVSANCDDF
jgi:hypothetical protein